MKIIVLLWLILFCCYCTFTLFVIGSTYPPELSLSRTNLVSSTPEFIVKLEDCSFVNQLLLNGNSLNDRMREDACGGEGVPVTLEDGANTFVFEGRNQNGSTTTTITVNFDKLSYDAEQARRKAETAKYLAEQEAVEVARQEEEKARQEEKEKKEAEEKAKLAKTQAIVDYASKAGPIIEDFTNNTNDTSNFIIDKSSYLFFLNDQEVFQLVSYFLKYETILAKLEDLSPPKEMKDIHSKLVKSVKTMITATEYISQGIDNFDVDLIDKATETVLESNKYMNEANDLLAEFEYPD